MKRQETFTLGCELTTMVYALIWGGERAITAPHLSLQWLGSYTKFM